MGTSPQTSISLLHHPHAAPVAHITNVPETPLDPTFTTSKPSLLSLYLLIFHRAIHDTAANAVMRVIFPVYEVTNRRR